MRTLIAVLIVATTASSVSAAESYYRWIDRDGVLHLSNRADRAPSNATVTTIEREPRPAVPPQPTRRELAPAPRPLRRSSGNGCGPADPSGLIAAVTTALTRDDLDALTLLVGGVPVSYDDDTNVGVVIDARGGQGALAATEQAAVAYPAGTGCPDRPALERYAVSSGRGDARALCDDYRRAFAEVGIAVNRDQNVARSLRTVADDFAVVAARGYVAGSADYSVSVPPWIVDAHVAQLDDLAGETGVLIDELTVALDEIDRAARASGCW
jgi:hypothetical protein